MNNLDKTMATNEHNEDITLENDAETTENTEQEQEENLDGHDEVEELRKQNKTLEAQKDHWRKKAQTKNDEPEDSTSKGNLSDSDMLTIMPADVHTDDLAEVKEFAKFKGISVAEALNNPVIKTTLSLNDEFRKTAKTSNTANARKGGQKVSSDTLIANLSKGEVPSTPEESEALYWARRGGKRG